MLKYTYSNRQLPWRLRQYRCTIPVTPLHSSRALVSRRRYSAGGRDVSSLRYSINRIVILCFSDTAKVSQSQKGQREEHRDFDSPLEPSGHFDVPLITKLSH